MIVNQKNVRKLVDALRGGKYHQIQGMLCVVRGNQTFHCCLGVACRLAIKDGVQINVEKDCGNHVTFNRAMSMPPPPVERWLGEDVNIGKLANMNDGGKSFKEIADDLENEYLR